MALSWIFLLSTCMMSPILKCDGNSFFFFVTASSLMSLIFVKI